MKLGDMLRGRKQQDRSAVDKVLFAGPKSKTANHEALATARAMQAEGRSREEIYSATGWFQGPDKHWRYEIDDSQAAPTSAWQETEEGVVVPRKVDSVPLKDVFKHDSAFDAYPGLGKMASRVPQERNPDMAGGYYPTNKLLELFPHDDMQQLRGTALHEMQHAIDHAERRPYGDPAFGLDPKNRSISEVFARTVEDRADLTPEERRARPPWLDYDVSERDMVSTKGFGSFGPAQQPAQPRNRLLDLAAAPSAKSEPQGLMSPQMPQRQPMDFDVKQLMTSPLTTTQQKQMLEKMDPALGRMFDEFNARLKKHYGNVPDEPTQLLYDLDPPDDAPADVKAAAERLRMMIERMGARPR